MGYLKVVWVHDLPDEPVWLYSELDEARFEVRKVEVYRDGRRGFADRTRSVGGSMLGEMPTPLISEFGNDPEEFEVSEIEAEEFELEWSAAVSGYER